MDKRTLMAVVLSVVVIIVSMVLQQTLFAPTPDEMNSRAVVEETAVDNSEIGNENNPETVSTGLVSVPDDDTTTTLFEKNNITIETDVFIVTFSNRGGDVTSIKLKSHKDGDDNVEMIYRDNDESRVSAFSLYLGNHTVDPVTSLFKHKVTKNGQFTIVEFSNKFQLGTEGTPFYLYKKYTFSNSGYLFKIAVTIENTENAYPDINNKGISYTLGFGPQIGPNFEKLDGNAEWRKYYIYEGGNAHTELQIDQGYEKRVDKNANWAAIVGKYFSLIAIPDSFNHRIIFSNEKVEGVKEASKVFFSRKEIKSSMQTDEFSFYLGPLQIEELKKYNAIDTNEFELSGLSLDKVIVEDFFLIQWIKIGMLFILNFFNNLIGNYGIAIILLTILIRILLYPLSKKSLESTAKMQELGPKLEAIKEKFKDNPEKMNQATAEMYQKEGINPLGGCLPMLLQFPIMIALFNLLRTHFELRGAPFIPPWINDLSMPESVFYFGDVFTVPFVNWTDLRILPILMVIVSLVSMKFSQPANKAQGNNQTQMLTLIMPFMFFFFFYEAPSGLVIYWTLSSLLQVVQQMLIKGNTGDKQVSSGRK